jgi:hypothetical protein
MPMLYRFRNPFSAYLWKLSGCLYSCLFAIALQCLMVLMLPLLVTLVSYVLAGPNFCRHGISCNRNRSSIKYKRDILYMPQS